jgi:hypothetical protein
MILGKSVDYVADEFHDKYLNQKLEIHEYLSSKGIDYRRCMAGERKLKGDCVYLMCAPSLNVTGGNHMIVVEITQNGKEWFIFDPNKGRAPQHYYSHDGGFELNGWIPFCEFEKNDILDYRARAL